MKIAVVGATGNVGHEVCKILAEKNFSHHAVIALASEKTAGKQISFGNNNLSVSKLTDHDFSDTDIAIFTAGSQISQQFATQAVDAGCVVIDNTSHFRMLESVPLIVPEVNIHTLTNSASGIIANPNCIAIQVAVVLDMLRKLSNITAVYISTYQSTSGAGKKAMDELYYQTKSKFSFEHLQPSVFPHQIAFNCIPAIGLPMDNGYTEEESKIMQEINKILEENLLVEVSCVRTPTFNAHGTSLFVEFENNIDVNLAYEMLTECEHIAITNKHSEYITNVDCVGEDLVFISRLRQNPKKPNSLTMWVMTDNLRKGAALNAVQIMECLVNAHEQIGVAGL